jgi:hypothetical protein
MHLDVIEQQVSSWNGVSTSTHRFGGVEFNLAGREIGHLHHNGMADISFNKAIRDQLVAEGKAEPHHILPGTGWITFYIHSDADKDPAIWLFRLAYLFHAARGRSRTAGLVDVEDELQNLHLSDGLQRVLNDLLAKR